MPILFGYNVRADMPEDVVYKMLSAFYKNRDKLASSRSGLHAAWRRTSSACRCSGINANPDIPVHPGLAKFLKEHKAWNDKWKIASSGS